MIRNCITSQLVQVCKSNLGFECKLCPLQVDTLLHLKSWIHLVFLCLNLIIGWLLVKSYEICILWQFEERGAINVKFVIALKFVKCTESF